MYACPDFPELLIKVTRPRKRPIRSYTKRLIRRVFPDAIYRNALKEMECELKAALKSGTDIAQLPLARSFGVVQTDVGPGLVVERIQSEDGQLARQLSWVCEQGTLSDEVLNQLNSFVKSLFQLQIVGRDIHPENIVYGLRNQTKMFVLIDGFGERNVIPLRTLSRRLNDRSLSRQMQYIADRTGLIWDKAHRAFRTV
ncbi:hypothetical protein AVO44_11100 [Ruegeria profundi]|uniref:PhoP regulatory network protein YrbL n=1 Tax=Ruegeria profundi TaxID=1685378 RepID=A0A0X3TTU3_9RHOB|nr:hypothetical protein AVO44_11100 [Ruegeria profundi]